MASSRLEISQAAAMASDWHGGMFSALYRFSCVARRHNAIKILPQRLIEQCLREIGSCIYELTKDKDKHDFKTNMELRESLKGLCLFRNYLSCLLMDKQKEFDLELLASDINYSGL